MNHSPLDGVGQLIKKHRLLNNLSQESLCKGICVVSYLSKIETGTVTPSEDIVIQLLEALNITYYTDREFLSLGESSINAFFKAYTFRYFTESERIFLLLSKDESKYLFSPLMLDYLIAKAYMLFFENPQESLKILDELSTYESSLSDQRQYEFLSITGMLHLHYTKNYKFASQALTSANKIKQASSSLNNLACYHFYMGEYPLSIDLNEQAFKLAIEDGNILCALNTCLLQAGTYSNMKNTYLMIKYYDRALNLCEGIGDIQVKGHIYYNLGATYLVLKDYDKALTYCLQSLALSQLNHKADVSIYHKLSLIYVELGDIDKAKQYLELAYTQLDNLMPNLAPTHLQTLDLLTLRINDLNYLYNNSYIQLLETIYNTIGSELHFGFKQFYGDYLIACYKANRRYKDALRITEELYVNTNVFPNLHP